MGWFDWWPKVGKGSKKAKKGRRGIHQSAKRGRRHNRLNSAADANAVASMDGKQLRAVSHRLMRDNPHARKGKTTFISNMVGDGIVPRADTGNEELDETVRNLWNRWAKRAEAGGRLDVYGLQQVAAGAWFESGEVLARRWIRSTSEGLAVPMQLQLLESDLIDHLKDGVPDGGGRILQGIEFDESGRRVAYWLLPSHPGDTSITSMGAASSKRVPAEELAHLYLTDRPGQVRGLPWAAAVMDAMGDLDDYTDAERMRKIVEACIVASITGGDGTGPFTEAEDEDKGQVLTSTGDVVDEVEPGALLHLPMGTEMNMHTPATVGGYAEYKRMELRSIAAGLGYTYELLSGDLSQVNFSSIRAGLIEFRRMIRGLQKRVFVPLFCEPIWEWFIATAILSGELPDGDYPVKWSPPRFEEVDRKKEAQADQLELLNRTNSRSAMIREGGRDPEEVFKELAAEQKMADDLGIVLEPAAPASESERAVDALLEALEDRTG